MADSLDSPRCAPLKWPPVRIYIDSGLGPVGELSARGSCTKTRKGSHATAVQPSAETTNRFYARRVAGGDCHHRHPGRALAAGRAGRARGGAAEPVFEQFETACAGDDPTSRCARLLSVGGLGLELGGRSRPRFRVATTGGLGLHDPALPRAGSPVQLGSGTNRIDKTGGRKPAFASPAARAAMSQPPRGDVVYRHLPQPDAQASRAMALGCPTTRTR